jgi:hypothetical protein
MVYVANFARFSDAQVWVLAEQIDGLVDAFRNRQIGVLVGHLQAYEI